MYIKLKTGNLKKKLNIDDKVSKYISDFASGGKENITIRQLLTHSAGINNDYAVLGSIIEKVTGQKQEEYIQNNIYKPLGLKSNIQDSAVLAQVMLNGGGYGGVKLFSKETVDQFIKPSNVKPTVAIGWDRQADAELTKEFGAYAGKSTYGMVGSDGSTILMDPENDIAVILLTSSKSYSKGFNGSIMSLVYETFMENGKLNEVSYNEPVKREAALTEDNNGWAQTGTTVDLTLLVMMKCLSSEKTNISNS